MVFENLTPRKTALFFIVIKRLRLDLNHGGILNVRKLILGRKCYKELLRSPGKLQLTHYRKASVKARNIIKKKKNDNFNKFIDELELNNNQKNFWNVIQLFRNSD